MFECTQKQHNLLTKNPCEAVKVTVEVAGEKETSTFKTTGSEVRRDPFYGDSYHIDLTPATLIYDEAPMKYVTAKPFEILHPNGITPEVDYKVISYDEEVGQVVIKNDYGNETTYHESHFYPQPTREEILPKVSLPAKEEVVEEDSFEGLVFTWGHTETYYLPFDKMSESQISFTVNYLKNDNLWDDYGDSLTYIAGLVLDGGNGLVWQTDDTLESGDYHNIETSFNDIFKEA